jgi:hypothetical protein
MHFWYATVQTLVPFKWCGIFLNDRRYIAVRYGALKKSDKSALPTVVKNKISYLNAFQEKQSITPPFRIN